MDHEKRVAEDDSSTENETTGNEHVEALAHERNYDDPSYVDHRAEDDRAD